MIKKRGLWDYELTKEGSSSILKINVEELPYIPSLEDDPITMSRTLTVLGENPSVTRIVFLQRRHYIYEGEQVEMLIEIAEISKRLSREKSRLGLYAMGNQKTPQSVLTQRFNFTQNLISNILKADPLSAYVILKRKIREEKATSENIVSQEEKESSEIYISVLQDIMHLLEKTRLINSNLNRLYGHHVGDREIYSLIFSPTITPDFMFTRLMAEQPLDGEQLDIYSFDDNEVSLFSIPKDIKKLYHLTPPEFKLTEDKYAILDLARTVLAEHRPREEEFLDPEKIRITFFNIGKDLIQELAARRNVPLTLEEIDHLADILVRYTVGFGLIEILLRDKKIQDITINSPVGSSPAFIVHQDYEECVTNIIPSKTDGDSWASKFRLLSGRPLDEANPVLDTELTIPGARARVAIIQKTLSPNGVAYAFRRHRDKPWTYPLFIKNRMLNPLSAGILSFIVDGARTILFAGTRSSGKTSLLGSTLVEIMRKYRIISVEDTLELPTKALRDLGYNIQQMKVRSALTTGGVEMPADEGIRTSLRLGDSSLIVGEIRSKEAAALYEAMRIGALANVVAGTIHGDSPYGVFDRVVNDLKVPTTSFKATDIIVISNPIKSSDGLKKWRRVLSITEVRKDWKEDPLRENGFVDLLKYNPNTDELEPTDELINGESEILKNIAGNIKEWSDDWDAVWNNITLRADMKKKIVDYSTKLKDNSILEADFTILANDMFHKISGSVKEDIGILDNKRILFEWNEWLKRAIRNRN